MLNKFERWLIKILLKILPWPVIRELHSEAMDKFNENIWKNDSEMAKKAAKEMEEFIAKQDPNYLEKINREAFPNLVPLDGIKQPYAGVIKKDNFGFKIVSLGNHINEEIELHFKKNK